MKVDSHDAGPETEKSLILIDTVGAEHACSASIVIYVCCFVWLDRYIWLSVLIRLKVSQAGAPVAFNATARFVLIEQTKRIGDVNYENGRKSVEAGSDDILFFIIFFADDY